MDMLISLTVFSISQFCIELILCSLSRRLQVDNSQPPLQTKRPVLTNSECLCIILSSHTYNISVVSSQIIICNFSIINILVFKMEENNKKNKVSELSKQYTFALRKHCSFRTLCPISFISFKVLT